MIVPNTNLSWLPKRVGAQGLQFAKFAEPAKRSSSV